VDYEAFLRDFYRLERFGIKLGLDVIADLLCRLGDPQKRFPAVHVTGTNGKGSVCAMVESVLRAAGYRTGLYTSPHLVRFNERIRVEGHEIANADVMRLYDSILPHMQKMAAASPVDHPTFFEATTAMAFQYFDERKVDIAVVEVGMGGRYDATNTVEPAVSVVTRVDLEHAEHLGRTVRRIAREKSGIIKEGRPAVTVDQEAIGEIEARCAQTRSALTVVGRDVRFVRLGSTLEGQRIEVRNGHRHELGIALLGKYQGENAALAFAAIEALRRTGWKVSDEQLLRGFREARWPARFQVVRRDPLVIVDSGHNPPAVKALAESFQELLPGRQAHLVFGAMADKELDAMAGSLLPLAQRLTFVRAGIERAQGAEQLRTVFEQAALRTGLPLPPVTVSPDVGSAVKAALAGLAPSDILMVAGSVYVAGEALEALGAG